MKTNACSEQIQAIVNMVKAMGYDATPIRGGERIAIGLIETIAESASEKLEGLEEGN
jgi:hypothetical protein